MTSYVYCTLLLCIKPPRCHMCWSYGIMHHFIASLAILFLETYSTHGRVTLEDTRPREKILDNVEQSSKSTTLLMAYDNGDKNAGKNLLDHIRDGHLPCNSFIKLFDFILLNFKSIN